MLNWGKKEANEKHKPFRIITALVEEGGGSNIHMDFGVNIS